MTCFAFDLETEMIESQDRITSVTGRSNKTSPYKSPYPIVATVCTVGINKPYSLTLNELEPAFKWWIEGGHEVVLQNSAFDLDVLWEHRPSMRPTIIKALDNDQVHDTMLLDWLIHLADGQFDLPLYENKKWYVPQSRTRSLSVLALEYCNMELDKDPNVRCGFGQFRGRTETNLTCIPLHFLHYAEQDALATARVFQVQTRRIKNDKWLSESIQVRALFLAQQMNKNGVGIDQKEAQRLQKLFGEDEVPLQRALVEAGLGEYVPVPKAPRAVEDLGLDTAEVRFWKEIR